MNWLSRIYPWAMYAGCALILAGLVLGGPMPRWEQFGLPAIIAAEVRAGAWALQRAAVWKGRYMRTAESFDEFLRSASSAPPGGARDAG